MSSQFESEVIPAELDEVRKRRNTQNLPTSNLDGPPSVDKNLVGLALSGGGIRSASVSLGVIQSLIKAGYFRTIDFLSTVSGGGYVGSCISSTLSDEETKESAFENLDGAEDTPALKHLRNNSNFLISSAAVDKLRLPTILLRGILFNLWLIMPAIVLAVFATEILSELWHLTGVRSMSPLIIILPFVTLVLLYPPVLRLFGNSFSWKMRNNYERIQAALLGLSVLSLVLLPVLWTVSFCIDTNWDGKIEDYFKEPTEKGGLFQLGIAIGGVLLFGFLFRIAQIFPVIARVLIKLLVTFIGPLVLFGVYLILCIFFVESPYFSNKLNSGDQDSATYSELLDALEAKKSAPLDENEVACFNLVAEELRVNGFKVTSNLKEGDKTPVSVDESNTNKQNKTWNVSNGEGSKIIVENREHGYLYIPEKSIFKLNARWDFYAVGLGIFFLNFFFFDANMTSTHGFYRDRLSKAFLIRADSPFSVTSNEGQKLSELNPEGSVAPYHLINTALNLPASKNVNLRGRNADFFTLSKLYCGSEQTGYCGTLEIEEVDHHMNLGSAMAISAGAAAPSMGTSTKKMFVFIMTLLNLRLGYWIPNPSKVAPASRLRKLLWPNVGPKYLLKEAFGKLNAKSNHVNLSDGGHIENLPIYQLLRRRCKLIIAVDAEADPDATFNGLVTLIRYARIDLGIRIDLQLDDLKRDESGLSKSHWSLATIHYGENEDGQEEIGHLLYLKSSLTGDENEYVKAYHRDEPSFPHQTTADQFFDETQFEVYRNLGDHIATAATNDPEIKKILPEIPEQSSPSSRKAND